LSGFGGGRYKLLGGIYDVSRIDTNWKKDSCATPLTTQDLSFEDKISIPTASTNQTDWRSTHFFGSVFPCTSCYPSVRVKRPRPNWIDSPTSQCGTCGAVSRNRQAREDLEGAPRSVPA